MGETDITAKEKQKADPYSGTAFCSIKTETA
jgi:hypothetical protein